MNSSPDKALVAADNGIYLSPDSSAPLRERALGQRVAWCEIALDRVSGKNQFLDHCAQSLQFPAGFGGNWDALADCLEDLAWQPPAGVVIHWRHGAAFAKSTEAHAIALEIFAAAASYWKTKGRIFMVLIDEDSCGKHRLPAFPQR